MQNPESKIQNPKSKIRIRPAGTIETAQRLLRERFGHETFLPGQEAALRAVLAHRNLLAVMPTGSGKSLLYQLPALLFDGLTLVVSPLISLMKDQVDELVARGVAATFINSSLGIDEQRQRIARCACGEIDLLYVAPERFRSTAFLEMLRCVQVARMAVDEAHCISEWGHDFRPDYRRLKQFREQMGSPLVTALTATATPRVQQDIIAALGLQPDEVDVHVHGFDRPNLILRVVQARNEDVKVAFVRDFLADHPGSGIIYAGTRRATERIAEAIRDVEPSTVVYHAGLESDERVRAQEAFMTGRARVAVATVAFGMGIDKANVRFVIHYHYPGSVEQYYQEIGRAGRDGEPSRCDLLYSPGDRGLREFLMDLSYPSRDLVEAVYEALWSIPDNPVRMTYRQIVEVCRVQVKEGQVGSAIRLFDGAGVTQALAGDATIGVGLSRPGSVVLADVRGPVRRRVLEALSVAADLETPGQVRVGLDHVCSASGLSAEQVRRALTQLAQAGHIDYEPPFRGRGVRKLVEPPPPFNEVPIDWERQAFLRGLEEEKLAAIEAYIRTRECRRRFIVRYFGERTDLACGTCDRCTRSKRPAGSGGGILERRPEIARPVLLCVRDLRFPLGVGRVAQVVTGSRQSKLLEWGLDENPAYGLVGAKQDLVKAIIGQLIDQGYLHHTGPPDRPVLALTDHGEQVAAEIDISDLVETRPASDRGETSRGRRVSAFAPDIPADDATRTAVLRCVAALKSPLGIGKVAQILTGSRQQWIQQTGADGLPVFGVVGASQQHVRGVITSMVKQGLLHRDPQAAYPVLELTGAGAEELKNRENKSSACAPDFLEPVQPPPTPPRPAPVEPEAHLDRLVEALLAAERDRARAPVGHLRLFHPRETASRLIAHFETADDAGRRARIVWAVGELGEQFGLDFLTRCTRSEPAALQRLAITATAKALRRLGQDSTRLVFALDAAREALCRVRDNGPPNLVGPAIRTLMRFPAADRKQP